MVILNSDKSFVQGYNAQAVVDADSKVIAAADLINKGREAEYLVDVVAQMERNTGRRPKKLSADAGYWSEASVRFLESQGIGAFTPPEKVKQSEWREENSPRGSSPSGMTVKGLVEEETQYKTWGKAL